jgi:hypothetical protein
MIKVSVNDACSFARSFDELTGHFERFYEETAVWLCRENPVLGQLLSQMATRLSGGDTATANVCLAVAGYGLRLMEHAEANRRLSATLTPTVP